MHLGDVMPNYDHPAAISVERLADQCDVRFVRRSGPGGQHRNKVSTGVVMLHRPSGVRAEAAERRSQAENRAAAMFRLRINLALAIRRPKEQSPPSSLWNSRCRGGKIELNAKHDDFPSLLAEALDHLAGAQFDPRQAVESLGCSTSQLVKLLKDEPRAMAIVNAERQRRGLHLLR